MGSVDINLVEHGSRSAILCLTMSTIWIRDASTLVSILSPVTGEPIMAGIGMGGKYRADGVPAGPVTIAVTDYQDAALGSADDIKKRGPGAAPEAKNNFPAKYADHTTSGFATTVQADSQGDTAYDLPMTK